MDVTEINELIKSQEQDGIELKRIWDNIKKDSSTRKTIKYIQDRSATLDSIYQRSLRTHRQLENQEIISTHAYITLNYFENNIRQTYKAAVEHLKTHENRLRAENQSTSKNDDQNDPSSRKLFIQKYRLNQLKKKILTAELAITENKPDWHLQTVTRNLEKLFQEIDENHIDLLMEQSSINDEYFSEDLYMDAQESYDEIIEKLQRKINDKDRQTIKNSSTKLPRITIPIFTGSYESWNSFYDLFKKIIDEDSTITITEKMQYLKTHVRGDAEKLIKHLTVNETNYKAALTLLINRYKDERLIVKTFIDKLLDIPKQEFPNAKALRNMHDTINESLEALKNQNIDISTWGPFLVRLISRKWDSETNIKYEDQLEEPNKLEDFQKMMKYLEKRFKSLESSKMTNPTNVLTYLPTTNKKIEFSTPRQGKKGLCWFCSNEHNIHYCQDFRKLDVNDRIKKVQEKQMCNICLMHDCKIECVSQKYKKCEICNKAHSTLLHRNYNEYLKGKDHYNSNKNQTKNYSNSGSSKNESSKVQQKDNLVYKSTSHVATHAKQGQKIILLATALVQTTTIDGTPQLLRVLCDQGSEASLCTEEVAHLLGHPKQKIRAEIKGIADKEAKTSNYMINVTLKPRFSSTFQLQTSLIILPKLTGDLPKQNLQQLENNLLENKVIADPTYYKKGPIDIILGAEDYSKMMVQGFEKLQDGIIAQNTELGWILSGFCSTENCNGLKIISLITRTEELQLSKFWELEEIPEKHNLTNEDKICEDFYQKTTQRKEDGTYIVRLPFKDSSLEYGNTRQKAAARLIQLERKLEKNSDLRQKYNDFMKEYLDLKHMRKVNKTDYFKGKYYIPHQAVIRDDAITTKVRAVFDASSKSSTNVSLNDNLHKGPRLQENLSTILLRWRKHKIVFMADVEKMYRFIRVHEDDLQYQRILWRLSPKQPIEEYELTTVTYGTTAAPYLAIKTLRQLAIDEQQKYPIASKVALQDFFVDDILSGERDINRAKLLQTQLINMLKDGGFNLRKWSSNSSELLDRMPKQSKDDDMLKLPFDESRKSLGVLWSPAEDTFSFRIKITTTEKPTKRFILSEISKIFDPLGWLQPITVTLKLLMQELWTSQVKWNEVVPTHIKNKWEEIQAQMKSIEKITIPRWFHYTELSIELHGFGDASEVAYGAVVYSRVKVNDSYQVTLLQAKSKVAPRKNKTTLPRLELCAALLLTQLIDKIIKAIGCVIANIYCWTDSMITLGWIRGEANRWQTFVANRVSEIQKTLPKANWNHVESADNPADVISRGLLPNNLEKHELWWNGPKWLQTDKLKMTKIMPVTNEEEKHCHFTTLETKNENEVFKRFSSFEKMARVLTYCLRFIKRQESTLLTLEEIDNTKKQILLQVQKEAFSEEYKILQKGQNVKKGSKLSSLDPFIDSDGLLRVGGRLQHSQLPYNQKHPILLPYDHHVTTIITRDAHLKTLHGGNRLMLAYLRQKYWILGGQRKVKSCINKCVKCIRYKAETARQKMASLPTYRVTQSYPYSISSCDFAGPIQVRAMKGRGHKSYKGYIAVFVCLATKAIHLELVGDLSTESFIAALRRFMARRGHVSHIYSDNATNFVGAANFLHKELLEITQSPQFQNTVTNMGTQWHFNPPAAPHFGGLCEAGVKSMKHHLRRVIGESTLTYEELTTFLQQIEACLNSRPLCIQTDNINDNIVLTPSHFLIGREAVGVPDPISNVNTDLLNKWRHIQKMKKDFWHSWTNEYLHQLQQRYKWKKEYDNLKVGTVVLIKDENVSPCRWPLAKIKEIHPGSDGATRVVTLQRSRGADQKRAIHKLIPLPVNTDIETVETATPETPVNCNIAICQYGNSRKRAQKQIAGKLSYWFIILLTLINIIKTSTANYTIKNLEPGIYIEQFGNATVDRGTFRIEAYFQRRRLDEDLESVKNISNQFKSICDKVIETEKETHCNQFYQHLLEEIQKLERTHEYLSEINNTRRKRGLFGQLMTSIFGVNDEVYRDIDSLQKNQQKLIDAANHQTKVMIKTISTVNQTEARIENKLNRFQDKLNQLLIYVSYNNAWYRKVNINYIHIQVMQSYHLAHNYITEIEEHYSGLLEIYLARATVYSIITPKHVADIIKAANSKLPTNLNIIQSQLIDTKISENKTHIKVFAYFPIVEKAKYTLLHVTPIPKKQADGSFQSLISQRPFMAMDYNNEQYFELTNSEFSNESL